MGVCESRKAEDEQGGQDMRNLWHKLSYGKKTNICCVCSSSWSSSLCNTGGDVRGNKPGIWFFLLLVALMAPPSNHYSCVPVHPLHLNFSSLASVCQVLVKKNSVISEPPGHIRIITCHQIWWQGANTVSYYTEGSKSHVDGSMHLLISYNHHL